jgi:hypothetical protein
MPRVSAGEQAALLPLMASIFPGCEILLTKLRNSVFQDFEK